MKYFNPKRILKISILLLILMVCMGSIYASNSFEDVHKDYDGDDDWGIGDLDDDPDDDFGDDDLGDDDFGDDDFGDDDLGDDDFGDDDFGGDDLGDDDFGDDDFGDDDFGGDDLGDDDFGDDDLGDDSIDNVSDFDYLKFKISVYLQKYGNCSDLNWTDDVEFLNFYQIYSIDSSNYELNKDAEGYETYLKIFNSIVDSFKDYNLTDNETGYLKFMVIFYLNHYGNCSANYTWNETEDGFNNFDPIYYLCDIASAICMPAKDYNPMNLNNHEVFTSAAVVDSNSTSLDNVTSAEPPANSDSGAYNIFIFLLMLLLVVLVII